VQNDASRINRNVEGEDEEENKEKRMN